MKRVVFEVVHWITRLCVKGFVTFDCHRHFLSTACRIALVARRTTPFSPTVTKMLALTRKLCMHSSFHFILRWQLAVTMNKALLASTFICNFMFVCSSTAHCNRTNFFLFPRGQKFPVVVYSWLRYLRASTVLNPMHSRVPKTLPWTLPLCFAPWHWGYIWKLLAWFLQQPRTAEVVHNERKGRKVKLKFTGEPLLSLMIAGE